MIKLPDPVAYRYKFKEDLQWQHTNTSFTIHKAALNERLYTESHLKQAVRDALEEAAHRCEHLNDNNFGAPAELLECVEEIRALIEEIE